MSIFDLKTSSSELSSINNGISHMSYTQVAPTRDVTGDNFANGQISIKFSTTGQKWWLPSRTYLRFRIKIAKADLTALTDAEDAFFNMNLCANLFQSCEFRIQDKTVSRCTDFVAQVDTLNQRLNKSNSYFDTVGRSVGNWITSTTDRQEKSIATPDTEFIWTPPLSIFGVTSALPAGDYELILNPHNSAAYKKRAIQSIIDDLDVTDFSLTVNDLFLYVCEVNGPRSDNMSYYLDLENIRCQSETIKSTSFQAKQFDVSPSTYALTIAYQDGRAGSDTRVSSSIFKCCVDAFGTIADAAGLEAKSAEELKLSRMYIQYAGQSLPNPDAEPTFSATVDRTVQRYLDTQLYSGSLFDSGGCESLDTFHARGSYYHFCVPRDGTDRSTRVQVHQGFATSTAVANMRVLLFDHYKSCVRIEISSGRVVSVVSEEV